MTLPEKPDLPWADDPVWKGIDCGPGWWPLIAELDRDLRAVVPGYRVVQVKEKFGGLRFYPATEATQDHAVRDLFYHMIHTASRESERICEECGQPGKLRKNRAGWLKTLCDAEATEWMKR